ncbi:hypothetical protein RQP53_15250 [Paucibacter sp. APW11]|uniref:Uncharacterized protein n=1 Tax=Roseateles aquae TaxID=3077235 RepID=A0ABU3PDE6_9BURK|nr:hypothetical protein [Paucibacter sp. APW11]MDT9000630.1 hypothetical protein [Paucibacter sp. APW11]
MKFIVHLTTGEEVVCDGPTPACKTTYYGGPPPETGRWHVDVPAFEAFCATHLANVGFGTSIEAYHFGLEIADIEGWGESLKARSDYCSYRPKMKALVSVGQIDWLAIKDQSLRDQMAALWTALLSSIHRVERMKRKPRDFDAAAFGDAVLLLMKSSHPEWFQIDVE